MYLLSCSIGKAFRCLVHRKKRRQAISLPKRSAIRQTAGGRPKPGWQVSPSEELFVGKGRRELHPEHGVIVSLRNFSPLRSDFLPLGTVPGVVSASVTSRGTHARAEASRNTGTGRPNPEGVWQQEMEGHSGGAHSGGDGPAARPGGERRGNSQRRANRDCRWDASKRGVCGKLNPMAWDSGKVGKAKQRMERWVRSF
ncbi:Hypothetical protein DEACI_2306 [Acididesulfobacillus acetoxydans]|uniref:Uncharacterized protein n=1 Tax=Acididesulfobacillus acetoxydans TaxID=1561005 RepID=A0A8S0W894_9FIRM|nr:Hypothetical protein DEACI_2306 [Acididesulfobacillus acetoxydans]CEJ07126.1 Hypothetical protein DEACI_1584 [Acididesulfobacillus acetoxydans]